MTSQSDHQPSPRPSSRPCSLPSPAALFHVRVGERVTHDQARISLHGELDISTVGMFDDAVGRATEAPCDEMVVDLSSMTFCDARGLSAFLGADRQMRDRQGRMLLIGSSARFRRLVGIAQLGAALRLS